MLKSVFPKTAPISENQTKAPEMDFAPRELPQTPPGRRLGMFSDPLEFRIPMSRLDQLHLSITSFSVWFCLNYISPKDLNILKPA